MRILRQRVPNPEPPMDLEELRRNSLLKELQSNVSSNFQYKSQNQSSFNNQNQQYYFVIGFTQAFYALVQMYSVPAYKEFNPALPFIITFPFFFGIMFGDIGHSFMLLFISVFLEKYKYFIYMMAFFSFYCGLIYNQFLGFKLNLFGSRFNYQATQEGVYPLGFDPIWGISQNHMQFQNSYKMKLSIIIGYIHMMFALLIDISNKYRQNRIDDILFKIIPKLMLLSSTIGFVVYLIIHKWSTNYLGKQNTAPSIISYMLKQYLGGGTYGHSMFNSYSEDDFWGECSFYLSIICILWLGFGKEIYNVTTDKGYQQLENCQQDSLISGQQGFILHVIQTLQFVLSCISSTTSYLRLFALSLAHNQLSILLLQTLLSQLGNNNPSILMLSHKFSIFFGGSLVLMVGIDSMQIMLHTLRLHWVQFMGKFYEGNGKRWNALGKQK